MKQLNLYYLGGGGGSVPDGRTVTPINDAVIWQKCAGISNPTYTTLAEILGDTGILQTLMASDNAVDYMVRSKDFIGNEALVPIMTDNTHPSGECIASINHTGREAYRVFDNDLSSFWNSEGTYKGYIGYHFPSSVSVGRVDVVPYYVSGLAFKSFDVKGSNDGLTWSDSMYSSGILPNSDPGKITCYLTNVANYNYYELDCDGTYRTDGEIIIKEIQFYSAGIVTSSEAMTYVGQNNYAANTLLADATWLTAIISSAYVDSVMNVKNPNMTSNTTPSGYTALANSEYDSNYRAWKAFDGSTTSLWSTANGATNNAYVEFSFNAPKRIYGVKIVDYNSSNTKTFKITGNDNGTWIDLSASHTISVGSSPKAIPFTVVKDITEYRMQFTATTDNYCNIAEITFYGREDV